MNTSERNTMKDYSIGILGVASYATADLFKRIIDAFPAEKEWDRPRIVVDNYVTMPSRVRAILYNENYDLVIQKMCEATRTLVRAEVDRIIVDCNTAHYFVPMVIKEIPEAKEKILHLIEVLRDTIATEFGGIKVGLIASEGVIDTGIYHTIMKDGGVQIESPSKDKYPQIRKFIESVKQSKTDDDIIEEFVLFINDFSEDHVILGCTELPILYERALKNGYSVKKRIHDPLGNAIGILIKEFHEKPDVTFSI